MRLTLSLLFLVLFMSCNPTDSRSELKSKNGIFTAQIHCTEGNTPCNSEFPITHEIPFNWAILGQSQSNDVIPKNSVFVMGENITCGDNVEFFPVAVLKLKSQLDFRNIVVGTAANPFNEPSEISSFFQFQVNHSKDMKVITDWFEDHFNSEWMPIGWEDERVARSELKRISKEL